MRFDLADLSLFRHVVEAGSITHGAERAHLALAAASTRIRNMEETLGAPLLLRRRQGVAPTPAGRTLLQHARAILRQAERLREDLAAYAGGLAGQDPDAGRVAFTIELTTPDYVFGGGKIPAVSAAAAAMPRAGRASRDSRRG